MMSETGWIIAEIFIGIAFLTLLTAVLTRLMGEGSKKRRPAEILDERYARGELTHEQYVQMRQDLDLSAISEDGLGTARAESRGTRTLSGTRQPE